MCQGDKSVAFFKKKKKKTTVISVLESLVDHT